MAKQPDATEKKTRPLSSKRSPSWPVIDIAEAIERARTLFERDGKNVIRPDIVASHWGYSPKSSNGRQILAALRAFGLLDNESKGVRLSERALRILHGEGLDPATRAAINDAALSPKIHRTIWDHYGPELPSDASLKSELILEHDFNPKAVVAFIAQLKRTFEFANLYGSSAQASIEESNPGTSPSDGKAESAPTQQLTSGVAAFHMTLHDGNVLDIRLHRNLSKTDFDRIFSDAFFQVLALSLIEEE